jgi:cation diffusion facilitator family transporter
MTLLQRHDSTRRMALLSIAVATVVLLLKYIAYLRTGSVALYSDAIESIVNVATAVLGIIAVSMAARPADRRHQFGHHKAEYVAAVIEGVLIVLAALVIIQKAYDAVTAMRPLTATPSGLSLNGLATLLNGAWSYILVNRGRKERSPALVAQGWHLLSDVLTSAGVLAGVAAATLSGWTLLDPLLAGVVAIYILWAGGRIVGSSLSGLLDEAASSEVARQIRTVISSTAYGALEAHDIKTRLSGPATFIEFHLVVPGAMRVAEAHDICDRIEAALKETIPGSETVIHIEPHDEAGKGGAVVI